MSELAAIPAVAQMADLGSRFVLWKIIRDETGKERKKPLRVHGNGGAKYNDPSTWATLDAAVAAAARRTVDGIGVMLGELGDDRHLVGIDLDLSRSLATGVLEPWGQRLD